jgi:glycerol-3-phosphate dehydrogenase (NAD(P)+)
MKIAVIGGGSWGTTLANMLAKKGLSAHLWVREHELLSEIKSTGENTWYVPGVKLFPGLHVSTDLSQVTAEADYFLFAVPSQYLRAVLETLKRHLPKNAAIICASKGIEQDTLLPMSEVVREAIGSLKPRFAMLSGPSFAREVIQEMPTAVSLGCTDKKAAKDIQELLATPYFRVYTNPDVRGVELGGAIKNIIAIAAGVSDGLGFGANARAALITRGLAEMSRLGRAMGANPKTFMGLSGMGDLVLTCTGDLSRNRQVGLHLAKGDKLLDILSRMRMIAEGVKTTQAVHALGKKLSLELPITEQMHEILYQEKAPSQAVRDLMTRTLKEE